MTARAASRAALEFFENPAIPSSVIAFTRTPAVEDRARELGFATVTCNTHSSIEAEADYVELLLRQRSDGIIFTSPLSTDNVRHVQQNAVPVCVIERPKDLRDA